MEAVFAQEDKIIRVNYGRTFEAPENPSENPSKTELSYIFLRSTSIPSDERVLIVSVQEDTIQLAINPEPSEVVSQSEITDYQAQAAEQNITLEIIDIDPERYRYLKENQEGTREHVERMRQMKQRRKIEQNRRAFLEAIEICKRVGILVSCDETSQTITFTPNPLSNWQEEIGEVPKTVATIVTQAMAA